MLISHMLTLYNFAINSAFTASYLAFLDFYDHVIWKELNTLSQPFPDVSPISTEARELVKAYKVKCKHLKSTTQDKYVSVK